MKLVLTPMYDIDLEDWDLDRINRVSRTYGKISRGIALRLQHLQGEEPEEIQQFQNTGFQTPAAPITTLFKKPLTAMDVGRYNICNRRNDHQPAPTPVPNLRSTSGEPYLNDSTSIDDHQPVSNSSISEIEKDCKYILECLTAQAPPAQVLSLPAPSVPVPSELASLIQAPTAEKAFSAQVSLAQVLLAQAPPVQALSASAPLAANKLGGKQHRKHLEQVHITSPSDICFSMDKFTNNDADAQLQYAASGQKKIAGLFEKSRIVKQTDNEKEKKSVLTQLPTMQS